MFINRWWFLIFFGWLCVGLISIGECRNEVYGGSLPDDSFNSYKSSIPNAQTTYNLQAGQSPPSVAGSTADTKRAVQQELDGFMKQVVEYVEENVAGRLDKLEYATAKSKLARLIMTGRIVANLGLAALAFTHGLVAITVYYNGQSSSDLYNIYINFYKQRMGISGKAPEGVSLGLPSSLLKEGLDRIPVEWHMGAAFVMGLYYLSYAVLDWCYL